MPGGRVASQNLLLPFESEIDQISHKFARVTDIFTSNRESIFWRLEQAGDQKTLGLPYDGCA